jgi:hypothetical protein
VGPGVRRGVFIGAGAKRINALKNSRIFPDTYTVTTAACTRTLYAPNPPQLDDPWLRGMIILLAVCGLAALASLGS